MGAHGVAVLQPLTDRGALGIALHPAMTFVGSEDDTARLTNACFAITAADAVGEAIASSLVLEMGGDPVRIAEADRTLYHAALAHGANHLTTITGQALQLLGELGREQPERVLGPLARATLDNALSAGESALTGPVARGDAGDHHDP